jgi:hypothetical protein
MTWPRVKARLGRTGASERPTIWAGAQATLRTPRERSGHPQKRAVPSGDVIELRQGGLICWYSMPLGRSDCAELVRQVQLLLREYDPSSFETVLHGVEPADDPRRYLVGLLQAVRHVYAERSGGMHGQILDSVNRYVRLPDGRPVRGLSVSLTPMEREVYGSEEVNLAELPDRSEFISQLDRLLGTIESEINWQEDR